MSDLDDYRNGRPLFHKPTATQAVRHAIPLVDALLARMDADGVVMAQDIEDLETLARDLREAL